MGRASSIISPLVLMLIISVIPRVDAYASGTFPQILNVLIDNNLLNEASNKNAQAGRQICEMFGGDYMKCQYVDNVGKGVCYAGGGDFVKCQYVASLSKGLCYAGGGDFVKCQYVDSIGKAICYAAGGDFISCQNVQSANDGIRFYNSRSGDRNWAWDQFYHSSGSLVWACRGMQTGQFAEKYKCDMKPRHDLTWPSK